MIQRIQTLYLAGIVIIGMLLLFLPFAGIVGYADSFLLKATGIYQVAEGEKVSGTVPLLCLVALGAVVALLAVSLYKSRKKQMRLCNLNLLVHAGLMVSIFLYAEDAKLLTTSSDDALVNYKLGTYLPLISMVLSLLAGRAVKKDDKLLRSVDRLR